MILTRKSAAMIGAMSRRDGYENTLSGLSGRRAAENKFTAAAKLTESELKALYDHNWLGRRIVDALVDQALRKPLIADPVKLAPFQKLNSDPRYERGALRHGLSMGRLCGGAVIILGVVGSGATLEQPLPVAKDGTIAAGEATFLEVLTRFDLESKVKYENHENPTRNGRTEVFKVLKGPLKDLLIHESRMIFCEGIAKANLDDTQADRDWPWQSVLQPVNEILGSYGVSWAAISHMIQEASMAYLKLKGLTDMLTTEDKRLVDERMVLLSVGRNVERTIFLEAGDETGNGEEFGRTAVSFADLPDLLREYTLTVCGAAKIPYIILMGDTPAGLNATGDSTLQQWYDTGVEYQSLNIKPKLDRMLGSANVKIEYSFAPLWEPTAAQAAEIRQKNLTGDQLLFTMSVIEPDMILEARGQDGSLGLTGLDYKKILAERAAAKLTKAVELTPTDNAKGFTLNEIRAQQGKDPITLPGTTTLDPDGDLVASLYEYKKQKQIDAELAATQSATNGASGSGNDSQNGRPDPAAGNPGAGGTGVPAGSKPSGGSDPG